MHGCFFKANHHTHLQILRNTLKWTFKWKEPWPALFHLTICTNNVLIPHYLSTFLRRYKITDRTATYTGKFVHGRKPQLYETELYTGMHNDIVNACGNGALDVSQTSHAEKCLALIRNTELALLVMCACI